MREFGPVDPYSIPRDELKAQALAAARGWWKPPDESIPVGWFRCFVCVRILEMGGTVEEALERYHKRFPGRGEPVDPFIICDDCNQIISSDLGIPANPE